MDTNIRLGLQFHKISYPTAQFAPPVPCFIESYTIDDDDMWNDDDIRQDIAAMDEYMEDTRQPVFGAHPNQVSSSVCEYVSWFYDTDVPYDTY